MATFALPSSPEDKKKILANMQDISDSMVRIQSEKDFIKETISAMSEDYELPKKFLNKFSKTYHKQNYKDVIGEAQDFEDMISSLVPSEVE